MSRFNRAKNEMKMKQVMASGGGPQELQQEASAEASKTLSKVGLDVDNTSAATIKQLNAVSIEKIRSDMKGNGLLKVGLALGGSVTERATLGYLSALTEQNWILIRQNELIIRLLSEKGPV